MLRNLKSQQRTRLQSKFTENDCEKVRFFFVVFLLLLWFFFRLLSRLLHVSFVSKVMIKYQEAKTENIVFPPSIWFLLRGVLQFLESQQSELVFSKSNNPLYKISQLLPCVRGSKTWMHLIAPIQLLEVASVLVKSDSGEFNLLMYRYISEN